MLQGEELFLHYGYDPNNCPGWYRAALQQYLASHPGLEENEVADPASSGQSRKLNWREPETFLESLEIS